MKLRCPHWEFCESDFTMFVKLILLIGALAFGLMQVLEFILGVLPR